MKKAAKDSPKNVKNNSGEKTGEKHKVKKVKKINMQIQVLK